MRLEKRPSTNRATAFSKDLVRFLNKQNVFNDQHRISWHRNWFSNDEKCGSVDVVAVTRKTNKPRVFIEAELLREYPASNIVKLWHWGKQKHPGNVLIIQAFSKAYRVKKRTVRELSEFIGKEMQRSIKGMHYLSEPMKYNPRPGGKVGAGRRRFHAHKLGWRVLTLCRDHL
jgi:hypothetical protein